MTLSDSEIERADAGPIDVWSSTPIHWSALYAIGGLVLAVIGGGLWAGNYAAAATAAFMLTGGGLLVYGRVQEQRGEEARGWRWAGLGVWGLVGCWNLIRVGQAWLAHGGG